MITEINTIDELVAALKELDEFFDKEENKKGLSEDGFILHNEDNQPVIPNPLLEVIDMGACGLLITPTGGCAWERHSYLSKQGFRVGPGEQDSFGWLTGVIHGRNFKFVYG